jgi:hypothetical protein
MMSLPGARDIAELVRLPALLSAPGDAWLGAAASEADMPPRKTFFLSLSSCCLYAAGMALNDYADREVDARERPQRPIPSERVDPRFALGLSAVLTVAGVGLAAAIGGKRRLAVSLALAGAVWAYDLSLKRTAWGPAGMAACRTLDVLMGAEDARALPAASVVGVHTAMITRASRSEARGGTRTPGLLTMAGTAAITLAAFRAALKSRHKHARLLSMALLGGYAGEMLHASVRVLRRPAAENLQRLVRAGVLGIMPLEGGMAAGAGAVGRAAVLVAAWIFARRFSRKGRIT